MPTFGLITEGVTDQKVIGAILEGFFDPEEIDVRPFLPIGDNTFRHQIQSFSNWGLVLLYCASPELVEAFAYVEYVVIHIDTDQCEDPGFGVHKHENGKLLAVAGIVDRVSEKLTEVIGANVWNRYQSNIIFAISVDTIECWLLPLYCRPQDKSSTLNCLKRLAKALQKSNFTQMNVYAKNPRDYDTLSSKYSKRRELMKHAEQDPSLAIFVNKLSTTFSTKVNDGSAK